MMDDEERSDCHINDEAEGMDQELIYQYLRYLWEQKRADAKAYEQKCWRESLEAEWTSMREYDFKKAQFKLRLLYEQVSR